MHRRPTFHHHRTDSFQHSPDVLLQSNNVRTSPSKFTSRSVSWDPAITVIEEAKGRQASRQAGPSNSSRDYETRRRAPAIHSLLATDSNAIFDARLAPAATIPSSEVAEPATSTGVRHLRLISRDFPWTLEVSNRKQTPLTCTDVFSAIYVGLSTPLTSSEWTLADDAKKSSMIRANRNRRGGSASPGRIRRIDWLGSRVYFRGITKDDGLGRERLLPEDDLWPNTWVVKFGSRID